MPAPNLSIKVDCISSKPVGNSSADITPVKMNVETLMIPDNKNL